MNAAIITRDKQYATPGSASRFAWKWLYRVNGVAIGTSVAEAEAWAKYRGMKPVRAWNAAALAKEQA